jgi:hypothetical protein
MLGRVKLREWFRWEAPQKPQKADFIPDRSPARDESGRARGSLVVFMRLLAGLWTIQGVVQWTAILLPAEPLFYTQSLLQSMAAIFFAVFDFVTAAGLWLAAPWGVVLWLLGAILQVAAVIVLPGLSSMIWAGVNVVLIAVYFGLARKTGHAPAGYLSQPNQRNKH